MLPCQSSLLVVNENYYLTNHHIHFHNVSIQITNGHQRCRSCIFPCSFSYFKTNAASFQLGETRGITGQASTLGNYSISKLPINPKPADNGKILRCSLSVHSYWNTSIPYPSCGYQKLVVYFKPKIKCQDVFR